jgi:sulfate adenylyltransferase
MRGLHAATWGPDGAPIRDPYAVGVLWMWGLPSYGIDGSLHEVEGGLGLGLFCWGFAYCPKCGGWTFLGGPGEEPLCGHEVDGVSGSLLRGVLLEGLRLPSVVMRPGWRGGGLVARLWASLRLC